MIEQIQQNRFDPDRLFIERGILRCLLHAVQQHRSLRRIMNNQLVTLGGQRRQLQGRGMLNFQADRRDLAFDGAHADAVSFRKRSRGMILSAILCQPAQKALLTLCQHDCHRAASAERLILKVLKLCGVPV